MEGGKRAASSLMYNHAHVSRSCKKEVTGTSILFFFYFISVIARELPILNHMTS